MNLQEMLNNKYTEILSKEETYDLIKKYRNGDIFAYKKIIYSNIKLVLNRVNNRFENLKYEKEELISIGIIGLIKSVKTFDISKNYQFSTYATKCIDNEILMFIRKLNKRKFTESLEKVLYENEVGEKIRLKDIITDETDYTLSILDKETYKDIRNTIETLKEKEKIVIKLYFGFDTNKTYNQEEIALMFNYSQSYVSKLIKRALSKLKTELSNKNIIELNEKSLTKRVEK